MTPRTVRPPCSHGTSKLTSVPARALPTRMQVPSPRRLSTATRNTSGTAQTSSAKWVLLHGSGRWGQGSAGRAAGSEQPFVFLDCPQIVGARLVGKQAGPQGPAHFADVKITAGVGGETVRPKERSRCLAGMRVAEAGQQLALVVDDANPRPEVGAVQIDGH